jgi:hypothetical protein
MQEKIPFKGKLTHRFFTESLDLWHEAGLLTCLSDAAFPFINSGSSASPVIFITKNLQQRELSLIFTRFPFNPQERNQMQGEGNNFLEGINSVK